MKGYIDMIDELEKIEEIITPPKYRRCCYNLLELIKSLLMVIKIKSR